MLQELKKFPKEMQDAYKKVSNRPDENTPAIILSIVGIDTGEEAAKVSTGFGINMIMDYVDENLLDLELDERENKPTIYMDFALLVARKITHLIDLDTNKSKDLEFYDNNKMITKLKQRDFTELGDLQALSTSEKADKLAGFYHEEKSIKYLALTEWEKSLFVDKALSKQSTYLEKNSLST